MATIKKLKESKDVKNDEFYTLWQDIADELPLYREQLHGKNIICPCDWDESFVEALVYKEADYVPAINLFSMGGTIKVIDVAQSKEKLERDINTVKCNFVKFLVSHAEAYSIKSISVSGYDPASGEGVRFQDIDYSKYDIVITNPPFSQFRDFIELMFTANKQFIVIGPQNALSYKDTFSRIMHNEMWLGYHYHLTGFILSDGTILKKNDALPRCCCWYTNLDVSYRHDTMILTESYYSTPDKYPKYYDFDAIDVNKTADIPCDYDGLMGVPVTFLQKYNPEQFEIVGDSGSVDKDAKAREYAKQLCVLGGNGFVIQTENGFRVPYRRIVIRNKEVYRNDEN